MSTKLMLLHAQVLTVAADAFAENKNPERREQLAAAAAHLATTYQCMREIEIHEQFHLEPPSEEEVEFGFSLPGEDPLKVDN